MYRIDYADLRSAAEIIYCFMTVPSLTNPECAIWDGVGIPETIVNSGSGFMSEETFCKKITETGFISVTCVASTDKADTRRVVLTLMPELEYMVLNFPAANGKPNEAERRLLKMLEI